ncbi:MAG: hypothetical protein AAF668_09995 [Pseudomonadota bacterium]
MNNASSKKLSLSFETVGSIVAMIVGLSALFVAWDQAQIMRKQQHASVIPIVNVDGGFTVRPDANIMRLGIQNDGIGPALVASASLLVDGKEIEDWGDFVDRFLPPTLSSGYTTSFDTSIGVLAPGESTASIDVFWPRNETIDAAFRDFQTQVFKSVGDQTNFVVCYCSVFDRCWRTNGVGASKPIEVDHCDDEGDDVISRFLISVQSVNGLDSPASVEPAPEK